MKTVLNQANNKSLIIKFNIDKNHIKKDILTLELMDDDGNDIASQIINMENQNIVIMDNKGEEIFKWQSDSSGDTIIKLDYNRPYDYNESISILSDKNNSRINYDINENVKTLNNGQVIEGVTEGMNFKTAEEVMKRNEKVEHITTGADGLNELMGGGIETRSITEIYGKFSTGKSQISHELAVRTQLPKYEGGLDGDVVFIDTENTFRPERIKPIAEGLGLEFEDVLRRIHVAETLNTNDQIYMADKINELIQSGLPIKLIIVDSLMAHFRAEYVEPESLAAGQRKLNQHLHTLQTIASTYNIAVLITNQIQTMPYAYFKTPSQVVGGHILSHASTYRILLEKGLSDKKIARLVVSSHLPEGEASFKVSKEGITD